MLESSIYANESLIGCSDIIEHKNGLLGEILHFSLNDDCIVE